MTVPLLLEIARRGRERRAKTLVVVPPYTRADGSRVGGYSYRTDGTPSWQNTPHGATGSSVTAPDAGTGRDVFANDVDAPFDLLHEGDQQRQLGLYTDGQYSEVQLAMRRAGGDPQRVFENQLAEVGSPPERWDDERFSTSHVAAGTYKAIMERGKTPPKLLYRGMKWRYGAHDLDVDHALQSGSGSWVDNGFSSTTESESTAAEFEDEDLTAEGDVRAMLRIIPMPGSRALDVDDELGIFHNPSEGEDEWVLPPGGTFKVIDHSGTFFDVEWYPPPEFRQ